MDFYLILQSIMDETGLKIPDIARKCALSDGTIRSAIVRKQKNVSLDVAFKLADGLGVSLERLNGMPEKVLTPVAPKGSKESPRTDESAPGDRQSGKGSAPLYSSGALEVACDYDKLDAYGQRMVQMVVIAEKNRCEEQSRESSPVTIYAAASDGARYETTPDPGITLPESVKILPPQYKAGTDDIAPAPEEK